ncbi:MAG: hypothetical protein ABSH39_02840 [Candidatus Acidiferrum sp.]
MSTSRFRHDLKSGACVCFPASSLLTIPKTKPDIPELRECLYSSTSHGHSNTELIQWNARSAGENQ